MKKTFHVIYFNDLGNHPVKFAHVQLEADNPLEALSKIWVLSNWEGTGLKHAGEKYTFIPLSFGQPLEDNEGRKLHQWAYVINIKTGRTVRIGIRVSQ